jgi:hypothetical protein
MIWRLTKIKHKYVTVFMLLLFFISLFGSRCVSSSQTIVAESSIESAEKSVFSAFEAVQQAESCGCNVSDFIVRLNQASDLLVKAKYLSGTSASDGDVFDLTARSLEIAETVKNEALDLKASVLNQREFIIKVYIIAASLGVAVFLFFMFLLWRWFKEYYKRRILGLKLEVAENVDS